MRAAFEIAFRNMQPAPAVERDVRERVEKLERFCPELMSCRVVVEAPHRRHHKGNLYHVRVDLTVPGEELVAGRDPAERHSHEDVHVAVRDAFEAARRQLQEYKGRHREEMPRVRPGLSPHGRVQEIDPEDDRGVIRSVEGHLLPFRREDVVDDFDLLDVGAPVRFVEDEADEGTRATAVRRVGQRAG